MKTSILSPQAGGIRPLAERILLGLLLALAFVGPAPPLQAATRNWLGVTANWSNPDNWSPFGVPQNGDSLSFPVANPFIVFSMNNDLANLSLNTITFTGAGYTISGNALTFIQGITDNHSGALNRVNCPVQFTSGGGRFNSIDVGQLEVNGTTTLANNQDLIVTALVTNITVSGAIQGNGSLVKRGEGALFLRGNAANTYTGPTRVEQGPMHLAKPSAAIAISANVIIDGTTPGAPYLSDDLPGQYPPALSMLITNGGYWGITNGATVTNLILAEWGVIEGSGLLRLLCDVTVERSDFPVLYSSIDCAVYLGDDTRTFRVSGPTDLYMDGQIIGPGPGAGSPGIIKRGGSSMYLRAPNIYFGPTVV
jgi:autotransporter-associated beta strand protein